MPISTVQILKINAFNNAMIKWFWTIFSLGAPENTQLHAKVAPLRRKQRGLTMHLLGKSPIIPQVIFSMSARALENKSQQKSGRAIPAYFSLLCWRSMFYRLVQSTLTCTCFDVGANKNPHNFSGRARDTGKLKKQDNFWLPRRRKECATEF